jgi:hypothetical protein
MIPPVMNAHCGTPDARTPWHPYSSVNIALLFLIDRRRAMAVLYLSAILRACKFAVRYSATPQPWRFQPAFGPIILKWRLCCHAALQLFSPAGLFLKPDQPVAHAMPPTHDTSQKI